MQTRGGTAWAGTSVPHLVIVRSGSGGMSAARALRKAPVCTMLVDRRDHHMFQPLLYQVETGAVSPGDIAAPVRHVLRRERNAGVVMDEAGRG